MKLTLVYPPISDPRAPQLALPALAAYLRPRGVEVELVDLNAEAPWWLARPASLAGIGEGLRRTGTDSSRNAMRCLEAIQARAEGALAVLKSPTDFFDPHLHHDARAAVRDLFTLAGMACPTPVKLSMDPADYEIDGVDPRRVDDLIRATRNDDANAFATLFDDFIHQRLAASSPDAVGISLTNRQQLLPGLFLARRLREAGHFVVLGGALISKFHEELKTLPAFLRTFCDGVICYEGERATLALMHELVGERRFSRVPGLVYLDRGFVRSSPPNIEDVNALPTPDFDGLPFDRYLTPHPVLPILLGKGCYFNRCKFCDIPYINHISPKAYRIRRPELVAQDLARLHRRYGAEHFVVTDEALPPKLLVKLADALEEHPPFPRTLTGYARLEEGFDAAAYDAAHRIGFRKLYFGLESASQATIDHMDKGTQAASAGRILRACRQAGILFHVFSIIGFPEETEARARETYAFFSEHRATIDHPGNSVDIHPFGLEIRSDYFRDRRRYGIEVRDEAPPGALTVGLHAHEWTNTRGLEAPDVRRLIGEFAPGLARLFPAHHARGRHMWPAMEEYAVLFASHYGTRNPRRDFPFLSALPRGRAGAPARILARLSAMVEVRPAADGGVVMEYLGRSMPLPRALFDALRCSSPRPVADYLADLVRAMGSTQSAEDLRRWIDQLVQLGMLQLRAEPLPAPPPGFTLAMFRKKELLRQLCASEAVRLGICPTRDETEHFAGTVRRRAGLGDAQAFAAWLDDNDLSEAEFETMMHGLLLVEMVEIHFDRRIRMGMVDYVKVNAAAVAPRSRPPPPRKAPSPSCPMTHPLPTRSPERSDGKARTIP